MNKSRFIRFFTYVTNLNFDKEMKTIRNTEMIAQKYTFFQKNHNQTF